MKKIEFTVRYMANQYINSHPNLEEIFLSEPRYNFPFRKSHWYRFFNNLVDIESMGDSLNSTKICSDCISYCIFLPVLKFTILKSGIIYEDLDARDAKYLQLYTEQKDFESMLAECCLLYNLTANKNG